VDLIGQGDAYRYLWRPRNVEEGYIDLRMSDDSMVVNATGDLTYHSGVGFLQAMNPYTTNATYKNDNTTGEIEKNINVEQPR